MLPTRLQNIIDKFTGRSRDEAAPSDDALLDLQIRAYLRSEYANEIPPSNVVPRLVRAIQFHSEEQQMRLASRLRGRLVGNRRQLGRAFSSLYHALGRGDASRLISSGLVTALMLFAMWPSMKQMLVTNYLTSNLPSYALADGSNPSRPESSEGTGITPVPTEHSQLPSNLVDDTRRIVLPQRGGQDSTADQAFQDPNYLDDFVERGLGSKKIAPLRERQILEQE